MSSGRDFWRDMDDERTHSLLWCKECFNDIDIYYSKKIFFGVESHIYDLCTFLCVFYISMKKEQHRTKVLMI